MPAVLVYDCEIIKGIEKPENRIDGIEYCAGWHDHAAMGISVIGAWQSDSDRYRIFCQDNFNEFQALAARARWLVGFNNIGFDNPLLRANGIEIDDTKCYDILRAVWHAAGHGPEYTEETHAGYGLEACVKANLPGCVKTGHGAKAPVLWQQGKTGEVIDYCLNDVRITKQLLIRIADAYRYDQPIHNPKPGGPPLYVDIPTNLIANMINHLH